MKKRIHVNQHAIKRNHKREHDPVFAESFGEEMEPVITVKTYKSNDYGHNVNIHGASKVIYSPEKPLPCGARVWIETDAAVDIDCKKWID